MATVDLTVAADLSALRRQLAEIPGLSADAATKMSAELNKSIKSAEKASLTAAKASKAAAEGAKASGRAAADALDTAAASATRFGDKAGAVGSNAGKLAGILDLLVPGLGGVARGVADVADTAEVASVATKGLGVSMSSTLAVLGPVAIAVIAAGAAYAYFSSQVDEAEAKQATAAEAATKQADATAQFAARKRDSADAFTMSGDAATAEGIAIRKSNELTDAASAAVRKLAVEKVASAKADMLKVGEGTSRVALNSAIEELKALDAKIELVKTQDELVITGQFATQREIKKTADAQLQAAAAAAKRAADEAALAEVERGILEQTQNYRSVLTSLQETTRATNDSQLTGAVAINAALDKQIEKVNELAAAKVEEGVGGTANIVEIEAARLKAVTALQAKAAEDIAAIDAGTAEKRDKLRQEELDKDIAAAAARKAATESATLDLLGATSEAFAMAAEEQSKTNKDAAMAMFVASKAAAVAQAVVNTALAISSANTLPPPANFIAMAAAGVSGAVSLAAIASSPPPSFNDTPGVQMMGQRGNVSLASGDYFAAARSPTELQRQVGATAGGGVSILQVRLGHKVLDQSVARTIQEGGRLSREISSRTKTGTTGHRSRA